MKNLNINQDDNNDYNMMLEDQVMQLDDNHEDYDMLEEQIMQLDYNHEDYNMMLEDQVMQQDDDQNQDQGYECSIRLRRSAQLAAKMHQLSDKESTPPLILGSVFMNSLRRSTRLMQMVH